MRVTASARRGVGGALDPNADASSVVGPVWGDGDHGVVALEFDSEDVAAESCGRVIGSEGDLFGADHGDNPSLAALGGV